jgi:hypothetical protein
MAKEAKMSGLLFVCPNSGQEISTGVEIDSGSFYQGLPRVLADIKCPDCGLIHNLFEVQSRLTDEPQGQGRTFQTEGARNAVNRHH